MFGRKEKDSDDNMIFKNREILNIEALFIDIKKDISSLTHSTNTLKGNMEEFNRILFKDGDSIINRLNSHEGKLNNIRSDMEEQETKRDRFNWLLISTLIVSLANPIFNLIRNAEHYGTVNKTSATPVHISSQQANNSEKTWLT